jgi:Na+-transporting methylmalonyl-CoA/oxaloacetate decarboxylase gamma subunit
MNKFLWISLAIVVVAGIGLLIVSFTSKNIETPKYKVIKTYDEVEVRLYPKMVVAKTNLADKSFDNQGSNGFRTIAGYIFGGNEKNEKIAMTAPVVMNMGDSASMYFVMPKSYDKSELPTPNSKNVQIIEEAEKTLAVITYGGFSSDEKIEKHRKQLEQILQKNKLQTKGAYLYMGYNAPWDIINRKNEVAIEVVVD